MKVGILTFHAADNYGAVLQAYALKEYIRSLGHDTEILNYCPKSMQEEYHAFTWRLPMSFSGVRKYIFYIPAILRRLFLLIPRILFCWKFRLFRERFFDLKEAVYWKKEDIPHDLDAYVMGSDQVWNPRISREGMDVYLGKFQTKPNALRIAYAVSAGAGEEQLKSKDDFKLFQTVFVREESLKEHLLNLGVFSELVADPTFLVEPNLWQQVAEQSKYNTEGKYILVYMMYYTPEVLRIAKRFALQQRIKIKVISPFEFRYIAADHFLHPQGPDDFVKLFRDAEYVITTSFHGTAFSVIFNKNFYFISTGQKGENRLRSLLNKLGLEHRLVEDVENYDPIDYTAVNEKLAKFREHSQQLLGNSLKVDHDKQ